MKLDRLLHGLAGDRQFLLVILLGNLGLYIGRVIIPIVLIVALIVLWWPS